MKILLQAYLCITLSHMTLHVQMSVMVMRPAGNCCYVYLLSLVEVSVKRRTAGLV